jgi:molybdopterin synthase catalytic subunit
MPSPTPAVRVLYFAVLRERCGTDAEVVEVPSPATVAGLKALLESRHAFLGGRWDAIRVAVNQEFQGDGHPVTAGDEVALVPPVAGGSPGPRVLLTGDPLDVQVAMDLVTQDEHGGVSVFVGRVRNHAQGRRVTAITYSAYEPMALKEMTRLVTRAEQVHLASVACHHRLGRLPVGEVAVVVAAASAHREACFAACRQVIEDLKRDVPIFKREEGEDGQVWVGMGP